MDTEGMKPHPIFEGLDILREELRGVVSLDYALKHERRSPTGPSVGWDFAFADMEDDDEREQAFAFSVGFADASEYHAETNWCDRVGLMVDWYEREDLRP
jgi:hypothetical protein